MQSTELTHDGRTTPVTVITGFLGSGKTTLLNALIKHPGMDRAAIVVNEFGEIGIDHLLVEAITEDIVLLQSGCICCQTKGDLIDALMRLHSSRDRGEAFDYDRILVETTGVADPVPIAQAIMLNPSLSTFFHLSSVVTTIDSVLGFEQLARFDVCNTQVAFADKILLTKSDLAAKRSLDRLMKHLNGINPAASILISDHGKAGPEELFHHELFAHDNCDQAGHAAAWLNKEAYEQSILHKDASEGSHTHGFSSVAFSLATPIDWNLFSEWLSSLLVARSQNILRVKGILNLIGKETPTAIHGVQHVFHPPVDLSEWPTKDRQSDLVFITSGIDPQILEDSLKETLRGPDQKETFVPESTTRFHSSESHFEKEGIVVFEEPLPKSMQKVLAREYQKIQSVRSSLLYVRLSGVHNPWGQSADAFDNWALLEICQSDEILDRLSPLIGPDIILWECAFFGFSAVSRPGTWIRHSDFAPIEPQGGVTVRIVIAENDLALDILPGSQRLINQSNINSAAGEFVSAGNGSMICHDARLAQRYSRLDSRLRYGEFVIHYMPATSLFQRNPQSRKLREISQAIPLINFANRPIWLVRGSDKANNNFAAGFAPATGQWAGSNW